jgi:hypothetical protein
VQAVLNLRVISPFLGMRESSLSPAFITVPKGAVVETSNEFTLMPKHRATTTSP